MIKKIFEKLDEIKNKKEKQNTKRVVLEVSVVTAKDFWKQHEKLKKDGGKMIILYKVGQKMQIDRNNKSTYGLAINNLILDIEKDQEHKFYEFVRPINKYRACVQAIKLCEQDGLELWTSNAQVAEKAVEKKVKINFMEQ